MADASLGYEPGVQRVLNTRDETRHYYNKIAKIYDLMAESSEGPMRELGLKKLAVRPGERALEVGFGTGHCLVELAAAVGPAGRVCGVDLSDRMVALALRTRSLDAARRALTAGGIAEVRDEGHRLVVPATQAAGVALTFSE